MRHPSSSDENSKEPSWKIPVTLADMKMRADHIGGEIKQADANIVAAKQKRDLQKEALRIAEAAVTASEEIAADRRAERDALAKAMYAYTLGLGEAKPTIEPGECDHNFSHYDGANDVTVCSKCGAREFPR